jgi:ATP-binding cassette subfamily F protein 3
MFQLAGIERRFGAQVLFRELSWTIHPGSRIGLIGPNGAGKTTLLKLLCGQDVPDRGEVHRPHWVRAGYLPQEVETVDRGRVLAVVLSGFPEASALEERLAELEARLAGTRPGDPELEPLTRAYGELRHRFEGLEGDTLESRAETILSGLGLPRAWLHRETSTLSGGWRMRVVLARLLLGSPELLLLDEPTNHLDLDAIAWLERFLESYEGAFVVVSHDRYFLNRMVREIADLDRGRLTSYAGNYDAYVEARSRREQAREKAARQQRRERVRVERFIERFRYKATKARQVQSRIRALEKQETIRTEGRESGIRFGFPPAPRSGDVVVRAEGVIKRFGDHAVYEGLNLLLRRGARVALVGPNGAGKSTLLRLLAGELGTDGGRLDLGHNVHVHYYAQHQLEALDPRRTVLEEIEVGTAAGERPRLRKMLGRFLFGGESVDKRVGTLSGGEKARLALAKMLLRQANLLLLDEPTNHLDLRSREVLEEALNEYGGTLVVVSHDRYFINRIATSIAEVGGGRVELHEGDYDAYLERCPGTAPNEEAPDEQDSAPGSAHRLRREEKRREAEERNRRYRERRSLERRLEPVEREIVGLERRLKELEQLQSEPAIYSDPRRAGDVGREKAEIEKRLRELYRAWDEITADPAGE